MLRSRVLLLMGARGHRTVPIGHLHGANKSVISLDQRYLNGLSYGGSLHLRTALLSMSRRGGSVMYTFQSQIQASILGRVNVVRIMRCSSGALAFRQCQRVQMRMA
jgi:hypothetical protein